MSGHFRYSVWDPLLIIGQIFSVQSMFYVSLGLWILLTSFVSGYNHSLDQMFLYKEIQAKDLHGRCIIVSFLFNSLCGSLALWYFIQRTKLCLDFTATTHLVHLLICWCYSGSFPSTLSWWLLNVISITVMCVCGEFMCMRSEMKAIPLTIGPKADL